MQGFSRVFSLINAIVKSRGGVLKKVTYHLSGSDIVIYFGVPTAHTNDELRAASAAIAIRELIMNFDAPVIGGIRPEVYCLIGIHRVQPLWPRSVTRVEDASTMCLVTRSTPRHA